MLKVRKILTLLTYTLKIKYSSPCPPVHPRRTGEARATFTDFFESGKLAGTVDVLPRFQKKSTKFIQSKIENSG